MDIDETLKGIDQFDWDSLQAPDVPMWLRDLASEDWRVKHRAYMALEHRFVTMGADIPEKYGLLSQILNTDAALVTVPFLIEFLKNGEFGVLELLFDIASNINWNAHKLDETVRIRAEAVHEAIGAGLHIYQSILTDENLAARHVVSDLLKLFGDET